jgi:hypothetical protein
MSYDSLAAFSLLRGYGAIVVGGMLGWSVTHLISRRGNDSEFRKAKMVSVTLAFLLLTLVCSVPLWWHWRLSEQEQNFLKAK